MPDGFSLADITTSDIVGLCGVLMITGTYAYLQMHRDFANRISYSVLNAVGSLMIIYSLMHSWNLASFLIETLWVVVSLYGIWNCLRKKKDGADAAADTAEEETP